MFGYFFLYIYIFPRTNCACVCVHSLSTGWLKECARKKGKSERNSIAPVYIRSPVLLVFSSSLQTVILYTITTFQTFFFLVLPVILSLSSPVLFENDCYSFRLMSASILFQCQSICTFPFYITSQIWLSSVYFLLVNERKKERDRQTNLDEKLSRRYLYIFSFHLINVDDDKWLTNKRLYIYVEMILLF